MVKDQIANLIVSLKNASERSKEEVIVPFTSVSKAILDLLQKTEYIGSYKVGDDKTITVNLKYDESGDPVITGIKRISKQSKRVYRGSKEIKPIRRGYGMSVITTPQGIISDEEARKSNIGGEVLFEIW